MRNLFIFDSARELLSPLFPIGVYNPLSENIEISHLLLASHKSRRFRCLVLCSAVTKSYIKEERYK